MILYAHPELGSLNVAVHKNLYSFQWENPEATQREEDIFEHLFNLEFEGDLESPCEVTQGLHPSVLAQEVIMHSTHEGMALRPKETFHLNASSVSHFGIRTFLPPHYGVRA